MPRFSSWCACCTGLKREGIEGGAVVKFSFVINRDSGGVINADAAALAQAWEAKIQALGHDIGSQIVGGAEAEDTLRASAQEADIVMVAGGDGTLMSAARAVADADKILAILPLGTMNLLAADLDLPEAEGAFLEMLRDLSWREIDMGEVNGIAFLNNVVLGTFAQMAQAREEARGSTSPLRWPLAAHSMWLRVLGHRRSLYRVITDTDEWQGRAGTVMVSNNPIADQIGLGYRRESLDAGVLACYLDQHRTGAGFLKSLGRAAIGQIANDPMIETFSATRLDLHSRKAKLLVSVDGEIRELRTPLAFRIHPKALRIIAPAG